MKYKICPYRTGRETQRYSQRDHTQEDLEMRDGSDFTMNVTFLPAPCFEKQCGVWSDGRCNYAAGHANKA